MSKRPSSAMGGSGGPPQKRARTDPNEQRSIDLVQSVQFSLFASSRTSAITRRVAQFLLDNAIHGSPIEIEGKLGILRAIPPGVEPETLDHLLPRLHLFLGNDVLLTDEYKENNPYKFQSGVEVAHFRHLNEILNGWTMNGQPASRNPEVDPQVAIPPVHYKRVCHIDKIYESGERISLNAETLEVVERLRKTNRGKIDIHTPGSGFDIRISANSEHIVPEASGNHMVTTIRCKDRMSYEWGIYSLDITNTHSYVEPKNPEQLCHELSRVVRANKDKSRKPQPYPTGSDRSSEVELEIKKMSHICFLKEMKATRDIFKVAESFVNHLKTLSWVLEPDARQNLRIPKACQRQQKSQQKH